MVGNASALATQVGPFEENCDLVKVKFSSGQMFCMHFAPPAYTFINEKYYRWWYLEDFLEEMDAFNGTEEEFLESVGVVTDSRCEYCKARLAVPPEMY